MALIKIPNGLKSTLCEIYTRPRCHGIAIDDIPRPCRHGMKMSCWCKGVLGQVHIWKLVVWKLVADPPNPVASLE